MIKNMNEFGGFITDPNLQKEGTTIGIGGVPYNPVDFDASNWTVEMVAKSLSKQCRYLGNTNGFYSVAQHSVRGAEVFMLSGELELARQFLFHDAGEAVYGDFSRPFKKILEKLTPEFKQTMETVDAKLAEKFGIDWPMGAIAKRLDLNLAQEELTFMLATKIHTEFWSPEKSYIMFMEMFEKLELMANYATHGAEYVNKYLDNL